MSTNPTTNTRFVLSKAPSAALAALGTMACGAAALYVIFAWAMLVNDGALAPFLVGLIVPALFIGVVLWMRRVMRRATSNVTTDDEGYAMAMGVLIAMIVITAAATLGLVLWAISGGWVWLQFWYGVLVLGLWVVATSIHLTYKFKS